MVTLILAIIFGLSFIGVAIFWHKTPVNLPRRLIEWLMNVAMLMIGLGIITIGTYKYIYPDKPPGPPWIRCTDSKQIEGEAYCLPQQPEKTE